MTIRNVKTFALTIVVVHVYIYTCPVCCIVQNWRRFVNLRSDDDDVKIVAENAR